MKVFFNPLILFLFIGSTSLGYAKVNFSAVSTANVMLEFKNRMSYGGGILLDIPIGSDTFIETGLLYSPKSFKFDTKTENLISSIQIDKNFIELPLTIKSQAYFTQFLLGLYLAKEVSSKSGEFISTEFRDASSNNIDVSTVAATNLSKIDYGAIVGFGWRIHNKFRIESRFYTGLRNISKIEKISIKYDRLELLVGYQI